MCGPIYLAEADACRSERPIVERSRRNYGNMHSRVGVIWLRYCEDRHLLYRAVGLSKKV